MENVGLLMKGVRILNPFFTLVFVNKCSLQQSLVPKGQKGSWRKEDSSAAGEDQVMEC